MCNSISNDTSIFNQIFPVLTFIVGLIATPIFQRIGEIKRLKRVEEYYIQLLKSLFGQVEAQIKELKDCIKRIDDINNSDIVLNKVSGRDFELLDRIDSKDLFKILILRKKGLIKEKTKIFNEINATLAFLNESLSISINSNGIVIEQIDKYRNDWNQSQKNISKLKNQFVIHAKMTNTDSKDIFLGEIHKIIESYNSVNKNKVINIFDAEEKLVHPLMEIVKLYSNDPRAGLLLIELQNSKFACSEMKAARKNHKEYLLKNLRRISKVNRKLKKVIEEIGNLKSRII